MLLIIDNYDSFTYNIARYFQCLGQDVLVFQHDKIDIDTIKQLNPTYLVISPGPNSPRESGISLEVIRHFYRDIPILGICLGHQCIGHCFGAQIIEAPEIVHGKTSPIHHHKLNLFKNLPNPFKATRYHSLAIDPRTLPACFNIDAVADQTIMAISHRDYPLFGLQFHPEAILTEHGMELLNHFLQFGLGG